MAENRRQRLRSRIERWEDLTDSIRDLQEKYEQAKSQGGGLGESLAAELQGKITELKSDRLDLRESITSMVQAFPRLYDEAIKWGFNAEYLPDVTADERQRNPGGPDDERGRGTGQPADGGGGGSAGNEGGSSGNSGGSGGNKGGGTGGGGGKGDPIDHLPGKLGKDYHFVKGPGGTVKVVYAMDIPGPKKGSIAFTVPKELYDRYGVDPDKVKTLTKAQMKKLAGFGPINEIKLRRGEHPFQSWLNQMKRKFGSAPSMLRDKEVMQTLYAAHLGQWDAAELKGALQQTKWYDTKRTERIDWLFSSTTADKKTRINTNVNGLQDYVRQVFGGVDWTEHGLDQNKIEQWAKNIASGRTGWDMTEAKSRIDEIARGIEGTSLWAEEERAAQGGLEEVQEWEDIFEKYRTQGIQWLGPNGRPSRETITSWAKKRASGEVSDGDYQQFLRQQREALYPYITGDRSWQEFADPYKAALQRVMGDNASIDWNHELLADLGAKDNNGAPTGTAMSLYDFNLLARDPDKNAAAYQQGTALYDQGADRLAKILQDLKGVA